MLNPEHEHVFFFVSGFLKIILKEISNYNYINFIAFRVTESHSKLTSYPGLWVKSICRAKRGQTCEKKRYRHTEFCLLHIVVTELATI